MRFLLVGFFCFFSSFSLASVWEEMQFPTDIAPHQIEVFREVKISDQSKLDIIQVCKSELRQANLIDSSQGRRSNSQLDLITSECEGRSGSSACFEEQIESRMNECAKSFLAKMHLKRAFRN